MDWKGELETRTSERNRLIQQLQLANIDNVMTTASLNDATARAEAAEAEVIMLKAEVARLREVLEALTGEEPPIDSDEALRVR